MDDLMSLYIDDTKEFLSILNGSIIALERQPDDRAAISEIFRAYHTMKSSTAAMNFKRTAEFIHHMEDLLHEMREGRIKVNDKIIKLLYESYDDLEKFLNTVLEFGNEGDLYYIPLMGKVEKFIQECLENPHAIGEPAVKFILAEEDLMKAKKELSDGNQIYKIAIVLLKDCAFKSVRAWMTFEDIAKTSAIICSSPAKPTSEDFLNGAFSFDGTKLCILAVSEFSLNDLFQELTANLNEIEDLVIEEIEPGFTAGTAFEQLPVIYGAYRHYPEALEENMSGIVDRIIGDQNHLNYFNQRLDVLEELREKTKECEFLLLELEMSNYSIDMISEIMNRFHTIQEISANLEYGMIPDIIEQTCNLMYLFSHQQLKPDLVSVSLIADMLKFIRRLCEKPELNENKIFLDEVRKSYDLLNNYFSMADKLKSPENVPISDKLGEILMKSGTMKNADVNEIIQLQRECYPDLKFGQIAVKENKADVKDVLSALHVQENVKNDQKNQSYIRIPANKVDNLVDHLGELMITQSLHKQELLTLLNKDGGKVLNNIIRMERIAKEIQDITMSLRMVSLKQLFQKIYRIGRDTAAELGKEITVETFGDETEIDRNIVDKLHDPMMHLIRNAISHGIEDAVQRTAAGKPAEGRVTISACNRRGNVYIEISDDGRGLSVEKIFKKAVEKELIDPLKKYTDDEILKFIYLPGFSTQELVNNISGRGVGMNVVQIEIVKLGGKIDIENKPGQGCSFILKIPVNLATINGTIVELFDSNYIIPTLSIKQILKPQDDQWVSIKGIVTAVNVRNEIVPIIPIAGILQKDAGTGGYKADILIVVEHEQKLLALPVKTILGKQEVVVKQLGSDFSNLDFISGATILGDGKVSLILDVEALFKLTEEPAKAN